MNAQISGERLTTLFRPRSVALQDSALALAAVIVRTGDLAVALGDDLESLEINPLRVDGAAIEALGAVVTWAGKDNG
jgi:hypothetical protein